MDNNVPFGSSYKNPPLSFIRVTFRLLFFPPADSISIHFQLAAATLLFFFPSIVLALRAPLDSRECIQLPGSIRGLVVFCSRFRDRLSTGCSRSINENENIETRVIECVLVGIRA